MYIFPSNSYQDDKLTAQDIADKKRSHIPVNYTKNRQLKGHRIIERINLVSDSDSADEPEEKIGDVVRSCGNMMEKRYSF